MAEKEAAITYACMKAMYRKRRFDKVIEIGTKAARIISELGKGHPTVARLFGQMMMAHDKLGTVCACGLWANLDGNRCK